MSKTYTIPVVAIEASQGGDKGAALAFFLLENTGSVLGKFWGHMRAADQRALFGHFLGKGKLMIDGDRELLTHSYKICFGTDVETNFRKRWIEL